MRYNILSICGELGSLHQHTPPHTNPSNTQQSCRPPNNHCAALFPHALVTSSQKKNNKNTTLTVHSLSGAATRSFTPPEPISCVASSHSSKLLFAGGASGRCYIWYVFTGKLIAVWDAHVGCINAGAFCDDDEAILTVGADAAARLFLLKDVIGTNDGRADACLQLVGHTLAVTCVAIGYAGVSARVVTASMDRSARVWHLASGTCVGTVALSAPAVDVVMTFDEGAFFVALTNGYIVCAHVHSLAMNSVTAGSSLSRIAPPAKGVSATCVAVSPEDEHLIVGYTDGMVRIYDARSLQMISVYAKHNTTAAITCVLSSSSGTQEAERALFERAPERVMDKSVGDNFMPLVDMKGGRATGDVAWSVISETHDCMFNDEQDVAHARDADYITEQHMQREHSLQQQIHSLQTRTQQLEEAGGKLIQLTQDEWLRGAYTQ